VKYLLQDVQLKFDQLVVFIDLSDMEDEAKGYQFDSQGNVISRETFAVVGQTTTDIPHEESATKRKKTSFKEFISHNTVLIGRVRNLAGWLRNKLRPWDRSLNMRRGMWTIDDKLYNDYGKQGLELADKHMSQLKDLLDQYQIPLTVVVYPWPDQIFNADLDSRQTRYWQSWCKDHQANFINLFPAFIQARQNPEDVIKTWFIPGDVHWNKKGHRFVADNLLSEYPFKSH
jgi:hypothetical protein